MPAFPSTRKKTCPQILVTILPASDDRCTHRAVDARICCVTECLQERPQFREDRHELESTVFVVRCFRRPHREPACVQIDVRSCEPAHFTWNANPTETAQSYHCPELNARARFQGLQDCFLREEPLTFGCCHARQLRSRQTGSW